MSQINLTLPASYFKSIIPPIEEGYVEWAFKEDSYEPYSFEVFDVNTSRIWFWHNWSLTLYISVVYVGLIYIGQRLMKGRKPFDLRKVLATWNFGLALFSVVGLARILPELIDVLQDPNGSIGSNFHRSVCVRDGLNISSAFWALAFCVSKLIELFDTAFIVLRIKNLIFLHWYHHMATLIVSWLSFPQGEPIFRYVGAMNLFVHSLMYTYYGFTALRFRPPRKLAMMITLLQLSQMAVGIVLNLYALHVKNNGIECARSYENIRVQMWIYASYLVLFVNFFYKSYISSSKKSKTA